MFIVFYLYNQSKWTETLNSALNNPFIDLHKQIHLIYVSWYVNIFDIYTTIFDYFYYLFNVLSFSAFFSEVYYIGGNFVTPICSIYFSGPFGFNLFISFLISCVD